MQQVLRSATVITSDGNFKHGIEEVKGMWHDDIIQKLFEKEFAKIGTDGINYYQDTGLTGPWPHAAYLNKYYNAIITIEDNDCKNIIVFIPSLVTKKQNETFKKLFSNSKYDEYSFGDLTLANNTWVMVLNPIDENVTYHASDIIKMLESRQRDNKAIRSKFIDSLIEKNDQSTSIIFDHGSRVELYNEYLSSFRNVPLFKMEKNDQYRVIHDIGRFEQIAHYPTFDTCENEVSEEIIRCFENHVVVPNELVKNDLDKALRELSFIFDIRYSESIDLIHKKNIIDIKIRQLYALVKDENLAYIKEIINNYIDERIGVEKNGRIR